MMTLPKLSAAPGTGTASNSFQKGFFSSSDWLLHDSRSKFASSSISPPSSGASGDMSLPKMSSNGFSSASSGNQVDFSRNSRTSQPAAKSTHRSVNAYYKHLERFKMERTKSLNNLNKSMRSGKPAILKPLKLWRPAQGREKMVWVYGNPWSESDPRYLRSGSGKMTELVERDGSTRPSTEEMNGYEKYVDDLDIGASARKKKLESRSLNSSTERRVGWASDPTSPPTRDLSIGGATLQLNNMRDFKLLARTKRVGKLKNRRGGKILPLPHRNNISLIDTNAMPNLSSLYSAKSDDLQDLNDSEDNESLIMSSVIPKKIPNKLKKIKKKNSTDVSLKEKQKLRNEKFAVVNGEDTPTTRVKDTDWDDSEKLNFYEGGQTSTESEDSLHRESDIPGLMSVSEPATRSQTGERLDKLDPQLVIAENDEVTLEENSVQTVPNNSEVLGSELHSDNNIRHDKISVSEESSTTDESDSDVVIDVVETNARSNPSDEALETSAVSDASLNNNKEVELKQNISDEDDNFFSTDNEENLQLKSSPECENASDSETSSHNSINQNDKDDFFDDENTSAETKSVIIDNTTDKSTEKNNILSDEEKHSEGASSSTDSETKIEQNEKSTSRLDREVDEVKEDADKDEETGKTEDNFKGADRMENENEAADLKKEEQHELDERDTGQEEMKINHDETEFKQIEPGEEENTTEEKVTENMEEEVNETINKEEENKDSINIEEENKETINKEEGDMEIEDKKREDEETESNKIEGEETEQQVKEREESESHVDVEKLEESEDCKNQTESEDYAKDEEGNSDETESSDYDTDEDSEYEDSSPLYSEIEKEDVIEDDLHLTDALTPEPAEDVEVTNPDLLDHFGEKIEGLIESDNDSISLKIEATKNEDNIIDEAIKDVDPDDTIGVPVDTNNVLTILEHNGTLEDSNDNGDHILPEVTFGGTVDEIVTKLTTKAVIHERSIDVDLKKADFAAFNWKPDVQFFQFGQVVPTPERSESVFNFGAGTPPPPQLVKRRPLAKLPRSRSIRRQKMSGLEKIHKS